MRKLNHPNIVDYIGIGYTDNSSPTSQRSTMFLVSELLEGGTLKRMVMNQMKEPHR
jgi:serine/threonine protein kinase